MRKWSALLVVALFTSTPSHAQLGKLLFGSAFNGEKASGKYRKNNVIRSKSVVGRDEWVNDAFRYAITKIATMAKAKSYNRIGMTKQTCGTRKMGASTISHECRILAQMVEADEEAVPEGKRKIVYYSVPLILAGTIVPEDRYVAPIESLPTGITDDQAALDDGPPKSVEELLGESGEKLFVPE